MSDKIECRTCGGMGWRLARLTAEQDFSFAMRNMPIPKVDCWACDGRGSITEVVPKQQKTL